MSRCDAHPPARTTRVALGTGGALFVAGWVADLGRASRVMPASKRLPSGSLAARMR